MYKELIKELRDYAASRKGEIAELTGKAADAIEQLEQRIDRAIDLYNRNIEKTAMYEAVIGITPEKPKERTISHRRHGCDPDLQYEDYMK